MQREPTRHLRSLTGVRFLAALAVFAWHVQPATDSRVVAHLVRPGPLGVSLFFVLSGFVLAWSHRPGEPMRRFWQRRFARIYPNYVVALAAAVLLFHFVFAAPIDKRVGVWHLLLLQAWSANSATYWGLNAVAWSLSVEALFYLAFPLVLPLIVATRRRGTILATLFMVMVVIDGLALVIRPAADAATPVGIDRLVYVFPPARLPEFLIGMILAVELRNGHAWTLGLRRSVAVLAGCLVVVMVSSTPMDVAALTVLPMGSLLVALAQGDLADTPSPLASTWMVRLGEWSYAFYLVHQMIINLMVFKHVPVVALVPLALLATVVVSGLLHRLVERPAERALRPGPPRQPVRELEHAPGALGADE